MKSSIDVALHFLKFRSRSVFEVKQKLKEKKYSEKEIEETIEVLTRNKLLDDAEFARMWVGDRNRFKPSGSFLLRLELRQFGIDEQIIEEKLLDLNEEELAKKALEDKGRYRNAESQKQAQFLQRRGFSTSVIYKIIKDK